MPRRHLEKIYVSVNSDFDPTGYMQPRSITWKDFRTFPIEEVRDFRPGSTLGQDCTADACFTVLIHGEEKHLYFERARSSFSSIFGRWFVEAVTTV